MRHSLAVLPLPLLFDLPKSPSSITHSAHFHSLYSHKPSFIRVMTRRRGTKRVPDKAESLSNPRQSISTSDSEEVDLESKQPRKKVRWDRDVEVDDSGVGISHDQCDSDSSDTEESGGPSKVSALCTYPRHIFHVCYFTIQLCLAAFCQKSVFLFPS